MSYKNLLIFAFIALIFLASDSQAQVRENQDLPTLTYSELIKDKELYLGKTVKVKSNWIYGFEWSFLCDSECKNRQHETWVDFMSEDDLCKGSKRKLKKGGDKFDNKAQVIFVGKLSSGRFGDGSYIYQFKVSCVEKFKKLPVDLK